MASIMQGREGLRKDFNRLENYLKKKEKINKLFPLTELIGRFKSNHSVNKYKINAFYCFKGIKATEKKR